MITRTRPISMRRLFALLTLALLAACSSGAKPVDDGTVAGDFVRVGGPAPGAAVPLRGSLRFTSASHTVTVDVGSDGAYVVQLPAGSYTVEGTSPQIQGGAQPCSAPVVVTVAPGQTLRQQVVCSIP